METHPTHSPPAAGADIAEADLARAAGVAREDLKKLRVEKLTPGLHWQGGQGRPVMITPAGVALLGTLLAADEGADAGTEPGGLQQAANAALEADRYCTLIVVKIGNPRILLAKKSGATAGEAPLRVMVREAKNFREGMEIHRCEASAATPGVFYHHGKLPRSYGRY